jgi:hypothetical protein
MSLLSSESFIYWLVHIYAMAKAYALFYCKAAEGPVKTELASACRVYTEGHMPKSGLAFAMEGTPGVAPSHPNTVYLSLINDIDALKKESSGMAELVQQAEASQPTPSDRLYAVKAARYGNASNETIAGELQDVMTLLYSSGLYTAEEPFACGIAYQEKGEIVVV